MIMQIMINLLQILIWPIGPYKMSFLPNLKLFGPTETASYRPKKLDKILLCYMGKWTGGHSYAYQNGCHDVNV